MSALPGENPSPSLPEADRLVRRTPATFREQWGDCGFTEQQLTHMWSVAGGAASQLPAHNFDHTLDTLWATMELADTLEADGITVNRRVLVGAALFHDAALHKKHDSSDPTWAERHSARLFGKHAAKFGYDQAEILLGKQVIKETNFLVPPRTPEGKVLIRADLSNLGEDYQTVFLPTTERLYEERRATGNTRTWEHHVKSSVSILCHYLMRDLSLGSTDSTHLLWQAYALNNVRELALSVEGRELPAPLQRLLGAAAVKGSGQDTTGPAAA